MEIKDIQALITGGSSGIGLHTARVLVEKGAKVAITARNEERLMTAAREIGATPIVADVSEEASAVAMVESAILQLGGLNTLVNNAGIGGGARLLDTTTEDLQKVLQTNLFGAMVVARECARHFVENGGGSIVNISSTAGKKGFPGGSYYCASKFALGAMSECWRAELRPHNVRVMTVYPSEVQTSFGDRGDRAHTNPSKLQSEDLAHAIVSTLTMHDRGFVPELTVWATNPED